MSNFTGVTFSEQNVSPSDDAIIRRAILPDGILTGCALSYSGYTLTMGAGSLIACGRQFRHPLAQNWAVADATSGYARLVLTIDLSRTATETAFDQIVDSIEYATAEDGFTELTQADINASGVVYQIEVCKVSLGTGGITGIISQIDLSRVDSAGGLNFRVVGGLTQPSGPAENTIWVETDTDISSYVFAASEPAEPVEGMVWIKTSAASGVSFNALKKNEIVVYPSACYQYVDGAWINKTARTYQDGEWKEWTVYLYNAGDECADLTGGWVAKALAKASGGSAAAPTITAGESTLTMTGTVSKGGVVHTVNKIDLTGKSTLRFSGTLSPAATSGFWATVGVWSDFGSTYQANLAAYLDATSETTGEQAIDVSSLSGEYYIGVALYGSSTAEMSAMSIE